MLYKLFFLCLNNLYCKFKLAITTVSVKTKSKETEKMLGTNEGAKHVVDCDASPFTPERWTVHSHKKGGLFELNKGGIVLFRHETQKGWVASGDFLLEKIKGYPILNANVLDYLIKFPQLIPEEWKELNVFFWGTLCKMPNGWLVVRCLQFEKGNGWVSEGWNSGWRRLESIFSASDPAALSLG